MKLQPLIDIAKMINIELQRLADDLKTWALNNILERCVLNLGHQRATLKLRKARFILWRVTLTSYMFGLSSQLIHSCCQYHTLRNASHCKMADATLYPAANTLNSLGLHLSHLRTVNVKLQTLADTGNRLMSSLLDYHSAISRQLKFANNKL